MTMMTWVEWWCDSAKLSFLLILSLCLLENMVHVILIHPPRDSLTTLMTVWNPMTFKLTWLFIFHMCPLDFHFTIHFEYNLHDPQYLCGIWWIGTGHDMKLMHGLHDDVTMPSFPSCCFFLCVFLKIWYMLFFFLLLMNLGWGVFHVIFIFIFCYSLVFFCLLAWWSSYVFNAICVF